MMCIDLLSFSLITEELGHVVCHFYDGNILISISLCIQAKAFPLVMAELDARSNKAAREIMQVGSRQPIQFSFFNANDNERKMGSTEGGEVTTINLPEESFVNVLQFLDGTYDM